MKKYIFLCFMSFSALFASWQERKAEGWAWYEKHEKREKRDENQEAKSAEAIISEAKEELQRSLEKALVEPSDENLYAYLTEQKKWVDKSAEFSKSWALFLLKHPEFDESLEHPTSQFSQAIYKREKSLKRRLDLLELAKRYGLFFFYKGSCPYSKAFADVLQRFALLYSWNVIAISLDGKACSDFFALKEDNGISKRFFVQKVPALFAVDPEMEKVVPLSFGAISLEQLEKNTLMSLQGSLKEAL